jgi:hypothetical protein
VAHGGSPARLEGYRPRLEIADIFRDHAKAFEQAYPMTPEQRRVMRDIIACRTAALGGHLEVCDACGHEQPSFHSCRNRHCPKCQSLNQARWILRRKKRILPTRHFHVVFTLPSALRLVALQNRQVVFNILFHSAAATLIEFGADPKWLGGQLGITAVLHSWTRSLEFHPHLHCIVTDGGLANDGSRWIDGKGKGRFLFPVHAVGIVFRAKFVGAMRQARKEGKLHFSAKCATLADDKAFTRWCDELFNQNWNVYAKRPFGSVENVFEYLGRYTHRVGISNGRLISYDANGVCFYTKEGKTLTLPPLEFIRRFLLHVLPKGFTKIRHFGLMAPANIASKLSLAREHLLRDDRSERTASAHQDTLPVLAVLAPENWADLVKQLTGIDPSLCPKCRKGRMVAHPLPRPP